VNASAERNRLRWRCRRGLLELDVLFDRFLETEYDRLGLNERRAFEALLELPDQLLLDWLSEGHQPPNEPLRLILSKIR